MVIWSWIALRHQLDVLGHTGSMGILEDSSQWLGPWFGDTCVHPLLEGQLFKRQVHNHVLSTTQILHHKGG